MTLLYQTIDHVRTLTDTAPYSTPPPPPPPPPAGSKTPIIKMTIKRLHILCLALPYHHHHHRGRKRKSRRRRKKKEKPKPLPKFLISMVRVGSSISNQLNRINEKRKGITGGAGRPGRVGITIKNKINTKNEKTKRKTPPPPPISMLAATNPTFPNFL